MGSEHIALALRFARELNPVRTLAVVLETLVEQSGAARGLSMRWDGRRFVGPAAERISETVLRSMRRRRGPVVYADAPAELSRSRSIQQQHVRSVMAVPLMAGDELIGAIYLDHANPNLFHPEVQERVAELSELAAVALDRARRTEESALQAEQLRAMGTRPGFDQILGKSRPITKVLRLIDRIADTDYPVLIEGESGTGKELVAHALHSGGRRAQRPFIPTNCGGMTEHLLASELFGHVRGAFTGAERDRPGLFEAADGGTLLLDEIEAMSPVMQESLLRALEAGEIRRVGETAPRRVDVRVIAASNVDLEATDFRKDLFYRIAVLRVALPPLRSRREDIPILADHLLETIAEELQKPKRKLHARALERLMDYPWPGNVRELQNALKRAATLADGNDLKVKDFAFLGTAAPNSALPLMTVDEYIRKGYEAWSVTLNDHEIAARLGISRKTLWARRRAASS